MCKQFLIGLAVAAIAAYSFTNDFGVAKIIAVSNAAELGYAPQISIERGVKVTVVLQNIPSEAQSWDFRVNLETHTQDMSDDMVKSSVLIASGKKYMSLGWEGSPPGGHHRMGLLRFKAIDPKPESVDLQIRLVGDPSPRNFKWKLK